MLQRLPVIVGVGEIKDRPDDPARALEPLALMVEALRRAEYDARGNLIEKLDSIDIVHQVSWRYEKTAQQLCDRLGIRPSRAIYGVTGGESPIRYLHEAALRIARGESDIAAIVGAEAQYAVNKARDTGVQLPWTPIAKDVENPIAIEGRLHPVAIAHGAIRPIHVYPFYENASHVEWEQTPRQALAESGELWSRFSDVAVNNPTSWLARHFTADEVTTPSVNNRVICFPYAKHMVANPAVNQGAAIILTSLEYARQIGLDESRLLFVWGGAAAVEPRDYLQRDQYRRSDAQDFVLNAARSCAEINAAQIDAVELYSCFPCVPKMTRRVLRLPDSIVPTVTGGLSFFGAPLNNYMSHATCAMARHLRNGFGKTGLLYGQGEFITKHHALVVSRDAPRVPLAKSYDVQAQVDAHRKKIPQLLVDYHGTATIETHTVVYDRDGEPSHGTIIAKTSDNCRIMARLPNSDRSGLAALTNLDRSPVGLLGNVSPGENRLLHWS